MPPVGFFFMSFKLSKREREYLHYLAMRLQACEVRGWKRYTSTYRRMLAFYNPKLGIVIKRPNCIYDPRTPRAVRVPTIPLNGLKDPISGQSNDWVAQPIVKKVRLREAVDILNKKLRKARRKGVTPDLHYQNVGWYKGKPVMFDW